MRTIGKADIEHYHGGMVGLVARTLTKRDWDSLTYPSRQRLLNKAVEIVGVLVNDEHSLSQVSDPTAYAGGLEKKPGPH